ncbi:MAG: hypothetical protein ACFB10_05235, partial [Salibacteraceae bacterium]
RYNLWSWNHLLDFANALLFWSPAALFLLGSLCIRFKGKIPWDDPYVRLISFALLLFLAMLFMVNPLLSMPMDWDLFCYPASLLMVLSLRVVHRLEPQLKKGRLYLATWGALLLGLPAFWVFTDSGRQQQRMEMIGRHVFKTYYEHSGTYLLYSLQGLPQDVYYEKKQSMVADLQPYALLGRDGKFAELLMDDALFLLMQRKQAVAARKRVLEAYAYDPNHRLMGRPCAPLTASWLPWTMHLRKKTVPGRKNGLMQGAENCVRKRIMLVLYWPFVKLLIFFRFPIQEQF